VERSGSDDSEGVDDVEVARGEEGMHEVCKERMVEGGKRAYGGKVFGGKCPRSSNDGGSREKSAKRESLGNIDLDEQGLSGATQRRVAQLIDFKSRHGHTWVTTDQHSKFYVKGLGGWVRAQRRARKRGEISVHLQQALVAAGFSWEGPPKRARQKRSLEKNDTADGCVDEWNEHGSEQEHDAEDDGAEVDWHDADEECDDVDDLEDQVAQGLWGCEGDGSNCNDSNCNDSNGYNSSSLEDSEMHDLNQLHLLSTQEHPHPMTMVISLCVLLLPLCIDPPFVNGCRRIVTCSTFGGRSLGPKYPCVCKVDGRTVLCLVSLCLSAAWYCTWEGNASPVCSATDVSACVLAGRLR